MRQRLSVRWGDKSSSEQAQGLQRMPSGDAIRTALHAVRAAKAVAATIRAGAESYAREAVLPRLVPVGPSEIGDETPAGRLAVIRRLAKALRGERVRGLAGHWTYSLNRHIGLVQALVAERAALGQAIRSARYNNARRSACQPDGLI